MNLRDKAKGLVKDAGNMDAIEPKELGRSFLGLSMLWGLFMFTMLISAGLTVLAVGLTNEPRAVFGGYLISAAIAVGMWWSISWWIGLPEMWAGVSKLLKWLAVRRKRREATERKNEQAISQAYQDARSKMGKALEAGVTFDLFVSQAARAKVRDALIVAADMQNMLLQLPQEITLREFPERSTAPREVIASFFVGADAVQFLRSEAARIEFNERLANQVSWLGVEYKGVGVGVGVIMIGRRYSLNNG